MHLDGTQEKQDTPTDAQDLICPICMSIAEDPHVTSCCNRVFCMKDADINQYTNGCPLCRKKHYSFKSSPKHKEMLEQLTIKCVCSEHIIPGDYEAHLERCLHTTFTCPHKTCREKNDTTMYNSQQLITHLSRVHCDEVSLHGSVFINKKSVEPYKKASLKYENLVSTLYSVIYPKMIEMQIKNSSSSHRTSPIFKCPHGHKLIEADHTKRKRKNGTLYSSPSYNCDICHHSFSNDPSWHCSCTDTGFDKCVGCLAFQLFNIDSPILKQACQDKEKQQEHQRRASFRSFTHMPRSLYRLLTGSTDDDEDDDDDIELFDVRQPLPNLAAQYRSQARNNGETDMQSGDG